MTGVNQELLGVGLDLGAHPHPLGSGVVVGDPGQIGARDPFAVPAQELVLEPVGVVDEAVAVELPVEAQQPHVVSEDHAGGLHHVLQGV